MALTRFKMAAAWSYSLFFFGCKSNSVASFHLIVLKFGMYVYLRDSSDQFENGADQFKNGRRSAIFCVFFTCKREFSFDCFEIWYVCLSKR